MAFKKQTSSNTSGMKYQPPLSGEENEMYDVGMGVRMGFERNVFLQLLRLQQVESMVYSLGFMPFIQAVDGLYSLLFPYLNDDIVYKKRLNDLYDELQKNISLLNPNSDADKVTAERLTFGYAKSKYRVLLLFALKKGFLPDRGVSFIDE